MNADAFTWLVKHFVFPAFAGHTGNIDLIDYMKERFDKIDTRLENIEQRIQPLVEYKAKSEASMVTIKYLVAIGLIGIPIFITLLQFFKK